MGSCIFGVSRHHTLMRLPITSSAMLPCDVTVMYLLIYSFLQIHSNFLSNEAFCISLLVGSLLFLSNISSFIVTTVKSVPLSVAHLFRISRNLASFELIILAALEQPLRPHCVNKFISCLFPFQIKLPRLLDAW